MIDLHVHSTVSDGTLSPCELASAGAAFSVMALTDHDATDGAGEFIDEAASVSPGAVRLAGAELDVEPGEGYHRFHMLALGVNPACDEFNARLVELRRARDERNALMVARLNSLGVAITLDDWAANSPHLLTRPSLAVTLVKKGYAADIGDAFRKWVGDTAPGYLPRRRLPQKAAIAAIHAAGGVAVMAHPKFWAHTTAKLRNGLAELKAMGLDGVEAVYQANTPAETLLHLQLAAEIGLVRTAGSDFHGTNKPDVPLGMTVEDEDAFLKPFFEALERCRGNAK